MGFETDVQRRGETVTGRSKVIIWVSVVVFRGETPHEIRIIPARQARHDPGGDGRQGLRRGRRPRVRRRARRHGPRPRKRLRRPGTQPLVFNGVIIIVVVVMVQEMQIIIPPVAIAHPVWQSPFSGFYLRLMAGRLTVRAVR